MSRNHRRVTGLLLTVTAVSTAFTLSPVVAHADTVAQHVHGTGGLGLYLHPDAPGLTSPVASQVMADGDEFDVDCFTTSDAVLGDIAWLHGTDAATGTTGYAADAYLDTDDHPGTEPADLTSLGIAACDQQPSGDQGAAPSGPVTTEPTGSEAVTFDRSAAAAFAVSNVDNPPSFPDDDCTWFASQALWAGGLPQTPEWEGASWDWGQLASKRHLPGPTKTAAQAQMLVDYLTSHALATRVPVAWSDNTAGGAQPGDLIAYHWNPGEPADQIDHLAVVSDMNADGFPNIAQHTPARHRYWSYDPGDTQHAPGWIQDVDRVDGQDPGVWLIHINTGPSY